MWKLLGLADTCRVRPALRSVLGWKSMHPRYTGRGYAHQGLPRVGDAREDIGRPSCTRCLRSRQVTPRQKQRPMHTSSCLVSSCLLLSHSNRLCRIPHKQASCRAQYAHLCECVTLSLYTCCFSAVAAAADGLRISAEQSRSE